VSGLKYESLEAAGLPLSELYDVVMLTGAPIHEIFGHQFEEPVRMLDFGESGTFKFGQNIRNRNVVLADNPEQTVEGYRVSGFTHFDSYGRARKPRIHLRDGKVVGFLGSEYADREKLVKFMGEVPSHFVGSASQFSDGLFPQPRMSCTVIDGQTKDVDLEGRILLVAHEGHTNPHDKTFNVRASECYVVRDGVPYRVIPVQVTGGINQALTSLILLNDWSYQTGMCGKPDPLPLLPGQHLKNARVPISQYARSQVWGEVQVYPLPITDRDLKILVDRR
jgi:predicted Zn-dependent protease